jgi:MYXO-CTERM domain-containing protein
VCYTATDPWRFRSSLSIAALLAFGPSALFVGAADHQHLEENMRKTLLTIFVSLCFSAPAFAQAAGEACDSANDTPQCAGTSIILCPTAEDAAGAEGVEADIWFEWGDCGDLLEDGTVSGACYSDEDGPWCAMPSGTACYFQTSAGDPLVFACGDASGPAAGQYCSLVDGLCAAHTATCTDDAQVCGGDTAVFCPGPNSGPLTVGLDCTAEGIGGTCSSGTCVGVPAGGFCDDQLLFCADGLTCNATDGTCGDGSGGGGNGSTNGSTNGGTTNGDTNGGDDDGSNSRDDDETTDTGGSCSSLSASSSLPLGLALFGLVLVRRRRRS